MYGAISMKFKLGIHLGRRIRESHWLNCQKVRSIFPRLRTTGLKETQYYCKDISMNRYTLVDVSGKAIGLTVKSVKNFSPG